jgi:hypothetical protein
MADNADELMHLLFADVEQMLERGVPSEFPREELTEELTEEAAPQPVISLEAILASKLGPRDLIPQPPETAETDAPPDAQNPSNPSAETAAAESAKPAKKNWNSLWLAVLCSSMLLSAGILGFLFRVQLVQGWSLVMGKFSTGTAPVAGQPPDQAQNQPKGENEDFLKYLQQALERLAHRDAEMLPSPQISPASPDASPQVAASPSPSPTVVYVPVYPSASPSPAASGTATAPTGAPMTGAKPAPSAQPAPVVSPVPNIAAATNQTLLGVLELGEKSAALFEVNGTPQRIEMGEQIGTSGWTLVSIKDQEAIVRRNGEVRSIYVGQKF